MKSNILNPRDIFLIALTAVIVGLILFLLWGTLNKQTITHTDEAFMPNIETLADSSALIVRGTIIDEGTTRNLRRDSEDPQKEADTVVPGTDYSVMVEKVLKGDIPTGTAIKVAINGGAYKGKSQPLEANVASDKSYIFFLIPSSMGAPNYFGAGVPFIFENSVGKMKAISSNTEYTNIFADDGISETEFLAKINLTQK